MIFKGSPIPGRGRARTLGFSTINLRISGTVKIPEGVYGVKATIHSHEFLAAMHAGPSPTFNDEERTVELHLINIKESDITSFRLDQIEDGEIKVETLIYLREILKFKSREELVEQIKMDVKSILQFNKNPIQEA